MSSTASLEAIFDNLVSGEPSAGLRAAAAVVKDKNGDTLFAKAYGKLNGDENSPPLDLDSVGWLASLTKLATSVCAMQLVDRGLLELDEDLGKHVPFLEKPDILQGFDDQGQPILQKATKPITLRRLLTHTSGFPYVLSSPLHQQWYAWKGREPNDDHYLEGLKIPLSLEPGSAWMYGKSTDWAGQVVEAISGMSLEDYMSKNIWEPLGMRSSTFFLQKRPDLLEKRAELERREPPANHPLPDARPSDESLLRPDVAFGGSGLHSSAGDYAKLLGALVSGDSKILSAKALEEMVRPQLDDPSALQGFVELPIFSPMPDAASGANGGTAIPVNQTLCGAVNLKDIPGKRKAGSIIWRGLSNGYWWLDLKTGIAAVVYLQVVPYGDELTLKLCDEFEKEVYRIWGSE